MKKIARKIIDKINKVNPFDFLNLIDKDISLLKYLIICFGIFTIFKVSLAVSGKILPRDSASGKFNSSIDLILYGTALKVSFG